MSGPIPDAALEGAGPFSEFAYFFAGAEYYRYDWALGRPDPGYPQALTAWSLPGSFAEGVDEAIDGRAAFTGKAYFFKGSRYVRYDWNADAIDLGPAPLANWDLPSPFADGIDAALNGSGEFTGKLYFFRGAEYVRYDWATDRVDHRAPLAAWALPGAFGEGVTAALDGAAAWSGKGYLFRGGEYVRYDWVADRPDPGYPRPVDDWELTHSFLGIPDTSQPEGEA